MAGSINPAEQIKGQRAFGHGLIFIRIFGLLLVTDRRLFGASSGFGCCVSPAMKV
jgi:hypothetical protein